MMVSKAYDEIQKDKKQRLIKKQNEFFSRISYNLNANAQARLNELDFHYLETSIEFGTDLINVLDALSNWEYTTKEEIRDGEEINLTRIVRINEFDEMKEVLIGIIDTLVLKMNEAIKSCSKIKEYYEGTGSR